MTTLPLTEELLVLAQAKLERAEQTLAADPTNEWLQKAVLHERDQVTFLRRLLSGIEPDPVRHH